MPTGDLMLAFDYNAIREKVISVLGAGYGTRGYGQSIISQEGAVGYLITQEIWNDLRLDLANILMHQSGSQPVMSIPAVGDVIRYGEDYPVTSYDTLIENAINGRFAIGASRTLITAKESSSHTGVWDTQAYCTASTTFSSTAEARHFFNSGGKIRFYSALTASTSTAQNAAWANLLDAAGTTEFGAATPTDITYYQLTDSFQQVKKVTVGSEVYPTNSYFIISAKCNVPDNSTGTATTITFSIQWANGTIFGIGGIYNGGAYGGGTVDGTLSIYMDELKATGPIYPSGQFTITSPLYALTPIIAE